MCVYIYILYIYIHIYIYIYIFIYLAHKDHAKVARATLASTVQFFIFTLISARIRSEIFVSTILTDSLPTYTVWMLFFEDDQYFS